MAIEENQNPGAPRISNFSIATGAEVKNSEI